MNRTIISILLALLCVLNTGKVDAAIETLCTYDELPPTFPIATMLHVIFRDHSDLQPPK